MKKFLLTPLAVFCLNWSGAALSADFIAVRIEAENYTSKSDRWVLTSPDSTPTLQPDPDPPHNGNASGNANLELLPDTRVTHEDEVFNGGMDGNFWGGPGGGPRIDYNVDVPEAGRYLVYVKTFSTGTEDNGLHVGVNGNLPQSGQRIQICSKHNWQWTSAQRTNENHCGVTKTIWLDFPAAGVNTVTFFAREDGFEIDQFLLLKETHDGTKDCSPTFHDKIRCIDLASGASLGDAEMPISQTIDGNTVTSPPAPPQVTEVDLDIDINAIGSTHYVDDTIEYRVKVTNNSNQDQATGTVATLNLPAGLSYSSSADCTESSSVVSCSIGNITTNDDQTVSFFATVTAEGNHRVDAQVTADQDDNISNNNTESETITASYSIPDYEASISMAQSTNATAVDGTNTYSVTVTNNGLLQISGASLQVTTGTGLTADCNPNCAVPDLAPGATTIVNFNTTATQSGSQSVTAELLVAGDADNSNNTATLAETVVSSPVALSDGNSIVLEAEAFKTSSIAATANAPQWFVVDENFSSLSSTFDPDNATASGVSENAYVELLPDLRVDDNAAEITGASNFNAGGVGSTLTYNVFFSEAGTYNVYARIRANNNQDASLHVGLNNDWPATASALSVCNPDGSWQWTNNTRNSTGCNTASSASISVASPGVHALMVSQDTDGLELDKLVLSKEPVTDLTGNGPAAVSFDPAINTDVSVASSLSQSEVTPGEPINLVVSVTNESANNAAGMTVTIDGLNIDSPQASAFDNCSANGTVVTCSVAALAANAVVTETFTIETTEAATTQITSSVSSAQTDTNAANNSDQTTLNVVAKSSGGGSVSVWLFISMLLLVGVQGRNRHKAMPQRIKNAKH